MKGTEDEIRRLAVQLGEERTLRLQREQYAALARRINQLPPRAQVRLRFDSTGLVAKPLGGAETVFFLCEAFDWLGRVGQGFALHSSASMPCLTPCPPPTTTTLQTQRELEELDSELAALKQEATNVEAKLELRSKRFCCTPLSPYVTSSFSLDITRFFLLKVCCFHARAARPAAIGGSR